MGGKVVRAVTDGKIVGLGKHSGVQGCFQIQLHSSVDNKFYWHGHLQNPKVNNGDTVKVGQPIAEVGNMELKRRGCSPGPPHLHIDRGCIDPRGEPQRGGNDPCRDPQFIEDLRKVWETLPPDADASS